MKRSAFAPKGYAPRPAKQIDGYTPRPRAVARSDGKARMVIQVPKFAYVRDTRLRIMCQSMTCQHCGMFDFDSDWAHSNWADHGKGRGIKASDVYVAALCWACHVELDQGRELSAAQRRALWDAAHAKTIAEALRLGLWPADIPIPGDFSTGRDAA